jgi:NAD(P)-dependent dehydrogenase (short-subunit alcohol dehydrogenase family)
MAPATDYTPFTLNTQRRHDPGRLCATGHVDREGGAQKTRHLLILDAGDSSMGTTFAAAIRETGCRFQLKPLGRWQELGPSPPRGSIFGPTYAASKTALNALTVAVAIELEPEGIKVNAVSPGFIKTNLNNYGARELLRRAPASRCASLCSDRMV